MRLAVIADVHGNVRALEAIRADLRESSPDLVLNLGDCVSGPLWPKETVALLGDMGLPTVRGNHDRAMGDTPRTLMAASDAFAFDRLSPAEREQLFGLPQTLVPAAGVLAFHATPTDDNTYLTEDIVDGRLALSGPRRIADRLGGARAPLLLCGHSHIARIVHGPDGMLIVNPGSAGAPGYIDDTAPRHVSEAGSPHARYAVLTMRRSVWSVDLRAIAYDWDSAARRAAENNRPEWARALATGFVR